MELELKTAYEWALELEYRILDYGKWDVDEFFQIELSREQFLEYCKSMDCKIKPNSTPRKPEKYLEKRMYGLVMYNLSREQKGIQHDHAVNEFALEHPEEHREWARHWKTTMMMNGGTSCDLQEIEHGHRKIMYEGSIQKSIKALTEAGIKFSIFREPDANMAITAVVFIADERTFLYKKDQLYPDFVASPYPWSDKGKNYKPSEKEFAKWEKSNEKNYKAWVEKVGGEKNLFLREFIKPLRFA